METAGFLIGIVGLIFTIAALLFGVQINEAAMWLVGFFKENPFSGLYESTWRFRDEATGKERTTTDYLELRQRGSRIRGELFFTKHPEMTYQLRGTIGPRDIHGEWLNTNKRYRGFFLWRKHSHLHIDGSWMGVDRGEQMQAGVWTLVRRDLHAPVSDYYFDEGLQQDALVKLATTLQNHETYTKEHEGLKLTIEGGVFDPFLGQVSPQLLEFLLSETPRTALDLGTGSGLYALYMAKHGVESVGVDISQVAVGSAQANARANGLRNVKFLVSDLFEHVPRQKFDLICANLPFTRPALCGPIKNYPILKSFACNPDLLKRFVFHVGDFLTPNGSVLLAFGSSGDLILLQTCCELANLDISADKITTVREVGETFMVFRLKPREQPRPST